MAVIEDAWELLDALMDDYAKQPEINQAGPEWRALSNRELPAIRAHGIGDFRGGSSGIGWGFTDNIYYETESLGPRQAAMLSNPRFPSLLARYRIPESTSGGCLSLVMIDGRPVATHYLNLLDQHDQVGAAAGYGEARSFFEIGGGFGANVHLLAANYPNIRKVLYLDIPPMLYIGTQYLKAMFGDAVRDYTALRKRERIGFADDDRFEILAIPPWLLERVDASIDVFHNAHSFVEIPKATVAAYAAQVERLLHPAGRISLTSYDAFDPNTTWHPDELPGFFPSMQFAKSVFPQIEGRYGIYSFVGRRAAPPG